MDVVFVPPPETAWPPSRVVPASSVATFMSMHLKPNLAAVQIMLTATCPRLSVSAMSPIRHTTTTPFAMILSEDSFSS